MHCQACVARVTRALQKVDGLKINEVTVGRAEVETDQPAAALSALEKAGYAASED